MRRCRQLGCNNVYERWLASFDLPANDKGRNYAIDCVRNAKKTLGAYLEEQDLVNPDPDAEYIQQLVWRYSEYILDETARIDNQPVQKLSWKQRTMGRIYYHISLRPEMVAEMKAAYKNQTGIDMDLDEQGVNEYKFRMGRERELAEGRAVDFCHDVNRDLEQQFNDQYSNMATLATGMSAASSSSTPLPPPPPSPLSLPSSSSAPTPMVTAPRYSDFRQKIRVKDQMLTKSGLAFFVPTPLSDKTSVWGNKSYLVYCQSIYHIRAPAKIVWSRNRVEDWETYHPKCMSCETQLSDHEWVAICEVCDPTFVVCSACQKKYDKDRPQAHCGKIADQEYEYTQSRVISWN